MKNDDKRYEDYLALKQKDSEREATEMKRFEVLKQEIDSALKSFRDDEESMIEYQTLVSMDFGKWYDLKNGVKFIRIKHKTKPCLFETVMTPTDSPDKIAKFGRQKHNCKEIVRVLKGELIERMELGKRYEVGDVVVYPKNYLHKPTSTVDSRYEVEFIEPKKLK